MTDRIRRVRPGTPPPAPAGGVTGLIARRTRRVSPAPTPARGGRVVALGEWGDGGNPVIDLLKASPPILKPFRGGEHVHVSDAIGKCVRKLALIHRLNAQHAAERIGDGQGITFAIGDALHDFVKARFVAAHPDKVWALWTCPCSGTEIGPCVYAARGANPICPHCGLPADRQKEFPLFDADLDLVGSPDLPLWLPHLQAFYVIEIKSISAAEWKELARPKPDHVVQNSFYWRLFHANGYPLVDRQSILYVNKEYSFKSPYKEFVIAQPAAQARLDPYLDDLRALKAAKAGGPLPARVTCASFDSPEAKKCTVCAVCFNEAP